MPYLPYADQVRELEKLARLDPDAFAVPERELPALGAPAGATCVVCGASEARPCGACGHAHYCGSEHQRSDERFHRVVCPRFAELAAERAAREALSDEALVELVLRRAATAGELASWSEYLGEPAQGPLDAALLRRVTDLATRPLTLAGVLGGLGLVSAGTRRVRVHVMAAAARELEVPRSLWAELARFFPGLELELCFVGPELPAWEAKTVADGRLKLTARKDLYHRDLWSELGRPELVIGYNCGLVLYPTWEKTIKSLIGSGVPFVITSYRSWEVRAEAKLLLASRARPLVNPQSNRFASRSARPSTTLVNDVSFDNSFVSAWR